MISDFRYQILDQTAHRPWPMRESPWVMTQTWHDLLFAHWPLPAGDMRRLVPPELPLDEYDGRAWAGVVPFRMTNVAPRGVPPFPYLSSFPELNVRTYVTVGGRPGVYFFSLDAARRAAVAAARVLFALPYFTACMEVTTGAEGLVRYRSHRSGPARASFEGEYAPDGPPVPPTPGTLEYFLTERYCLYTVDRSRQVHRVEIHHPPWPLQRARAEIRVNTMAAAAGIQLPAVPPLLHFSRRQDVVAWWSERVSYSGARL